MIPLSVGRRLVAEYCDRGVTVRFDVLPLTEHLTGAAAGGPVAVRWLADRFADREPPDSCD